MTEAFKIGHPVHVIPVNRAGRVVDRFHGSAGWMFSVEIENEFGEAETDWLPFEELEAAS